METPVVDFARAYAARQPLRLHMPGHKGIGEIQQYDITEIDGADSLHTAHGIIRQSEQNASSLFGCETLYSAEGSSLCIRAMLYLAAVRAGRRLRVLAARNVHTAFVSAAALLDIDVHWLCTGEAGYLSCTPDAAALEAALAQTPPVDAVYLTSPDYLGHMADIAQLSAVCHRRGVLLLVDAAHGAYL